MFSRYWALGVLGIMTWPFVVTWSHRSWPFGTPYAISYWWSVGTKPLSTISNGFRDMRMWRNVWHDLTTTSKQRSRSFILVQIDLLYATSYRLSIL